MAMHPAGTQALEAFFPLDSLLTCLLHGMYRVPPSTSGGEAIRDTVLLFHRKSGGFGSSIASQKEN